MKTFSLLAFVLVFGFSMPLLGCGDEPTRSATRGVGKSKRKSTTGGLELCGSKLCDFWSFVQALIALSAGEAES